MSPETLHTPPPSAPPGEFPAAESARRTRRTATREDESQHVPRYRSLFFRVIMLCAVLLLCLLSAVYVITFHYARQVVGELEKQSEAIADSIMLHFTDNPNADLGEAGSAVQRQQGNIQRLTLDPATQMQPNSVSLRISDDGRLTRVVEHTFMLNDKPVKLTAWITWEPRREVLRAFTNTYLATITLVFLVTLCVMVYTIGRTLRPLSVLTRTCVQISEGNYPDIEVRKSTGEVLALEQTFKRMVKSLREKETVEAHLRQAQRLSALGTLAAGVAHDVRNPLNAIKLLSSHAIDTIQELPESDAAVRRLETIRTEVDRLEDIVSGFLSLAKERELQPEPCRIDALLQECVGLIQPDAETRQVRVLSELRAHDVELKLDPKQFRRAILNVLINAMEACRPNGRVRLFSRISNAACEIEIRDDGPGMTRETLDQVFDPYFTTKRTGTGLGLSITRGIIEEHGGMVEIHSSEGQGCQVLITMPLELRGL
mgnify:CR=1 FL=1